MLMLKKRKIWFDKSVLGKWGKGIKRFIDEIDITGMNADASGLN